MPVVSLKMAKEDYDFMRKAMGDLQTSDVLRAALDLLFSVIGVTEIKTSTVSVIYAIRTNLKKQGIPISNCFRVVIDLYGAKTYCT